MLLCDAADEVGGKLYVMGGGWTHLLRANEPSSMALAIVVAVPWEQANQTHRLTTMLMTEDGEHVTQDGQPIEAGGRFEVGRPAGMKKGSDLNSVFAFSFHGIQLGVGGYVWELRINDTTMARAPFRVGSLGGLERE